MSPSHRQRMAMAGPIRWVFDSRRSVFGLPMTLVFDLWPFQQFPRTLWIFVASLSEIPPLSTKTSSEIFLTQLVSRCDLDLWPLTSKTFSGSSLAWRISVPGFMKITALITVVSCHGNRCQLTMQNGRPDERPVHIVPLGPYRWQRRHKNKLLTIWPRRTYRFE